MAQPFRVQTPAIMAAVFHLRSWAPALTLVVAVATLEEAASFVGEDDMVLVVAQNGETGAYPVRQIAYHHLVQDVVGGVPIVVTY